MGCTKEKLNGGGGGEKKRMQHGPDPSLVVAPTSFMSHIPGKRYKM